MEEEQKEVKTNKSNVLWYVLVGIICLAVGLFLGFTVGKAMEAKKNISSAINATGNVIENIIDKAKDKIDEKLNENTNIEIPPLVMNDAAKKLEKWGLLEFALNDVDDDINDQSNKLDFLIFNRLKDDRFTCAIDENVQRSYCISLSKLKTEYKNYFDSDLDVSEYIYETRTDTLTGKTFRDGNEEVYQVSGELCVDANDTCVLRYHPTVIYGNVTLRPLLDSNNTITGNYYFSEMGDITLGNFTLKYHDDYIDSIIFE